MLIFVVGEPVVILVVVDEALECESSDAPVLIKSKHRIYAVVDTREIQHISVSCCRTVHGPSLASD